LSVADGGKPCSFEFDGKSCKFPALDEFVSAAKQQSFILRRRILLSFINCKPAERYKALEGFLNLSAFESFERGIKAARVAEEAKASSKSDEVQRGEQRIRATLAIPVQEYVSRDRCVAFVNATLSKASLKPVDTDAAVAARLAEVKARLTSFANIEELTNLTALKKLLQEPPSLKEIVEPLAQLIAKKAGLAEEERKLRGSFFEGVLKKGIEWITTDKLGVCPLCENSISIEKVKSSVERRLAENLTLTSYRTDVNRISASLAASVPIALAAIKSLNNAILAPLDRGTYGTLTSVEEALVGLSKINAKTSPEDLGRLAQKLDDNGLQVEVSSLGEAATAALEAHPNEMELFGKLTAASNALSCLVLDFSTLERLRIAHEAANLRAANMKKVCDHAEASRKPWGSPKTGHRGSAQNRP
jgi:hypothetical protein